MQVNSFLQNHWENHKNHDTLKHIQQREATMTNDVNKMIYDAQMTSDIIEDAISECIDQDIEPNVMFTTALQTILLTMFNATPDKERAISAAKFCITAADMMDEQQNNTVH